MRKILWALTALAIAAAPGQAAWVWIYEGERHVVMPPEEGQPAWAAYPDADDDGRPDPIITKVKLRVENEAGENVSKIRVGRTLSFIAEPELGGLELETLTVQFHLRGPGGPLPVVLAESIREPQPLGLAPPTYRASYHIPEEPAEAHAGDYEVGIDIKVGAMSMPATAAEPVAFRAVGPREATSDKVARKVKRGLGKAADEAKEFGKDLAEDIGDWWEDATEEPPPGALRPVQPRTTMGMVVKLSEVPTSPLAPEKDILAIDRAGALRSKDGAARSILFVPYDEPQPLTPEGWVPLGQVMLTGVRISALGDVEAMPWTAGTVTGLHLALEMEPGDTEGYVHFLVPEGQSAGRIPANAEWFGKMVFPSETEISARRHPEAPTGGLVKVKMVVPLPKGSVRAAFDVPVVGTE